MVLPTVCRFTTFTRSRAGARAVLLTVAALSLQFALAGFARAQSVTYGYDALGRLACVSDTSSNARLFVYDAVGNMTAINAASGSCPSLAAQYSMAKPLKPSVQLASKARKPQAHKHAAIALARASSHAPRRAAHIQTKLALRASNNNQLSE